MATKLAFDPEVTHDVDSRTRWRRRTARWSCEAAQGSPAPCGSPARGGLGEVGAGDGSPPQRPPPEACDGGAGRGWRERDA